MFENSPKTRKSEKSGQNDNPTLSLRQLFRYANAKERLFVIIGSFVALLTGFSWNLLTIAFGDVVDVFVEFERKQRQNTSSSVESNDRTSDEFLRDVYFFSASLVVLWMCNLIGNFVILTLFPLSASGQLSTIKTKYFRSVLRQDNQWFDSQNEAFASRVTTDLKRVEEGLGEKLGLAVYHSSTAVLAVGTAFCYGWKLTLVVLSLLPFLAFGTSVMNKVQATFARKEVEAYASAGHVAEEVISGIRTVVAFGAQKQENQRYCRHLEPALRSGIKRNFMTGLGNGLMFSCLYGGLALGIYFGVQMIIASAQNGTFEYTVGTIVIVFWSVSGAGFSIGGAAPHFEAVAVARATAARVFQVIERRPPIDVSSDAGRRPAVVRAEIQLKDVQFSYPSRPEIKVLNGFNLSVKSGENVALVGPSGGGKSTVIQLLQRFYDPTNGSVFVDGIDVKEWHLGTLRDNTGVVGQEPVLFDLSVKENIVLGSKAKLVTEDDVISAAKEAKCHEFVERLPEKYETRVGHKGRQLSGGQRQRVAIARALMGSPKLLLLDEATSALDSKSETEVQEALENAAKGRTVVVVAHRLRTVRNCDRIVVVSEGRVREEGSHVELMEKRGVYYDLVLKQGLDSVSDESVQQNNEEDVEEEDNVVVEDEEEVAEEEVLRQKFSHRRLLGLLSRDKWVVMFGLFLSLVYGLIVPLYAFVFGAFVDIFAEEFDPNIVWIKAKIFALYYIGLAVGVGVISVSQMTLLGVAGERLTLRLRKMAFSAILRQEIRFFDQKDNSCSALCSRLSSDASHVQGASGSRAAIICQALATFTASAVLGLVLSWQLSIVALLFVPFILIGAAVGAKADSWNSSAVPIDPTRVAVEALAAIRTVKSLHKEQHFGDEFAAIVESGLRSVGKRTVLRALTLAFCLSIVFLSYSVVFLFGGILVSKQLLTSGNFFVIIETLIYGSMTVGQSSVFTSDYRKAKLAAANIFRLLDRNSSESQTQSFRFKTKHFLGNISFNSIHFSYPTRRQTPVLRGLSLKIRAGETVALVGASGCGKSTLVQLIEKFYDVTCGQLTLDDIPIDAFDRHWLRRQMAIVSQEPTLFSGSIRHNIAYGVPDAPMEAVIRSAEMANINDFICDLPLKYDTQVGQSGTLLSGGQRQRIAIARALLRDPRLLVLDEATAALDTASESAVQSALESARVGRTCLIIAHRLSTVRSADRIVVLERGRVVEEGKHDELLLRKGKYFALNRN